MNKVPTCLNADLTCFFLLCVCVFSVFYYLLCRMVEACWELLDRAPQLKNLDVHAYRRKPSFDLLDAQDISFAVPRIECTAVASATHGAAEVKEDDGGVPPTFENDSADEHAHDDAYEDGEEGDGDEFPPPPPSPPRAVKQERASSGLTLTLSKSLLKAQAPIKPEEPAPKLSLRLPRGITEAPEPAKTVKAESGATGPYRTRGLRLSSKFLSAATDADIGNDDGGDGASGAPPLLYDDEEGDDEEQHFHGEGDDDDDDSFSDGADEDEEDTEDYLPSKKRKTGGVGARAQPQKKPLTLRQKYMQQMMRR